MQFIESVSLGMFVQALTALTSVVLYLIKTDAHDAKLCHCLYELVIKSYILCGHNLP